MCQCRLKKYGGVLRWQAVFRVPTLVGLLSSEKRTQLKLGKTLILASLLLFVAVGATAQEAP